MLASVLENRDILPTSKSHTEVTPCSDEGQAVSTALHALVDKGLTDSALRELLRAWELSKTVTKWNRTV